MKGLTYTERGGDLGPAPTTSSFPGFRVLGFRVSGFF